MKMEALTSKFFRRISTFIYFSLTFSLRIYQILFSFIFTDLTIFFWLLLANKKQPEGCLRLCVTDYSAFFLLTKNKPRTTTPATANKPIEETEAISPVLAAARGAPLESVEVEEYQ